MKLQLPLLIVFFLLSRIKMEFLNVVQTPQPRTPPIIYQNHDIHSTTSNQAPTNWSFLIKQFISKGSPKEALHVYTKIRRNGIYNLGLIPLLFKVCAKFSMINHGKALHAESVKAGICIDVMVSTSMVDMYGKCGEIVEARKVFDDMPVRNSFTFNAIIAAYMRKGDVNSAKALFENMEIRTEVSWTEMIDGFSRNGNTESARSLFDRVPLEMKNVVTWTVMVDGYANNGEMGFARDVFEAMPYRNSFVWSSMISGYFKKGDFHEAKKIFDRIPQRNLVNWNSFISGYAQNGFSKEALESFSKMQDEGFEPDEITVVSALSACAQLGQLKSGQEIHHMINKKGLKHNHHLLNGLVDMYAKCGDLSTAKSIFDKIFLKNASCWNSMIAGFSTHGHASNALDLFNKMKESNEKPDDITFLSVLSACAHAGFVNEGLEIFSKMEKYSVVIGMKHYGCLIDLLGRAGKLKDAYALLKKMPMRPSDVVLGAFLGACRTHMDTEIASRVMKEFGTTDCAVQCGDDTHYVLMSNIYAASKNWKNAEKLRIDMTNKGLQKTPGQSSFIL